MSPSARRSFGAIVLAMACLAGLSSGCGVIGSGATVTYQGYRGTAIVSADGRTLIVGEYGDACPAHVSVLARETTARVGLYLQYRTPAGATCPPGAGALGRTLEQRLRLHAPLGHRVLVDGATGRPTAWISARLLLRPTALPDGYRLKLLIPVGLTSLPAPGRAGATQSYQPPDGSSGLLIIQSTGAGVIGILTRRGPWTPITVRGHSGRATGNLITWQEHGMTDVIFANGGLTLTTRQLVAIADSAPA